MRFFLSMILFLATATGFAQESPPIEPPKVVLGMQHGKVIEVLKKSKWKKVDDKTENINGATGRTITYKWDTHALTVYPKVVDSLVILKFTNEKLIKIDRYYKDKKPLHLNLKEIDTY